MRLACWICGADADSAEHRFKKSDLVRAHGKGPYIEASALSHFRDGKETKIQGPGSKHLKYFPSLCQYCNNTHTQPFDRAYQKFIARVLDHHENMFLGKRFIDLAEVYGSDWENQQRNLYKYFAKSFGCRLVNAGVTVPADVLDLIDQEIFHTRLGLTMAVNEDLLLLPHKDHDGFIAKSSLLGWSDPGAPDSYNGFELNEHVSWLTICYWYNRAPDGRFGSMWVADTQFLYLGSFAPLDEISRQELLEKVKCRDNMGQPKAIIRVS